MNHQIKEDVLDAIDYRLHCTKNNTRTWLNQFYDHPFKALEDSDDFIENLATYFVFKRYRKIVERSDERHEIVSGITHYAWAFQDEIGHNGLYEDVVEEIKRLWDDLNEAGGRIVTKADRERAYRESEHPLKR